MDSKGKFSQLISYKIEFSSHRGNMLTEKDTVGHRICHGLTEPNFTVC